MSDPSPAPEGAFVPEGRKTKGAPLPDGPPPAVIPVKQQGPPSLFSRYGITVLVAALVAAVVAMVVSVGVNVLMAKLGGGRDDRLIQEGKATLIQEGDVTVGDAQEELQVFYVIPFAGPPHLQLEFRAGPFDAMNFVKLKEQKADHFTVQYTRKGDRVQLHWRAEGLRRKGENHP